MDAKGRIAIPSRNREELNDKCAGHIVITASPDDCCVIIYPQPLWEEILPKIIALPDTNKKSKKLKRFIMAHAYEIEMDASGRILVPPALRIYGSLEKKVNLVGQGNKLELWSEDRWNAWLNDSDDDEMPEEMRSLTL